MTSPYLSWWSRWKHIILGVYTAFSYNCAVSWPPEQFSQGNLCQGSLGTTTTSNPYSASSAGQLNLCWANPMPTNMHHRKKKSPSQYRQLLGSEFSFFFFGSQAAHLLSSASPLLSLHWLWCFNTVHSLHSCLFVSLSFWGPQLCPPVCLTSTLHCILVLSKKVSGWGEITWVNSLQNSLKRDGLVLRTCNPLFKIQQANHRRTYITLRACSGIQGPSPG